MWENVPTLPNFTEIDQALLVENKLIELQLNNNDLLDNLTIDPYMQLLDKRAVESYPEVRVCTVTEIYLFLNATIPDDASVKLSTANVVVLPLFDDAHFSLAVLHKKSRTLTHYDSSSKNRHSDYAKNTVTGALEAYPFVGFRPSYETGRAPKQKTNDECGVFACGYADFASREAEGILADLTAAQIRKFRPLMAWDLASGNDLPVPREPL